MIHCIIIQLIRCLVKHLFTIPYHLLWTGELIGIEYLFSQTGQSLGVPSDEDSDGPEDDVEDIDKIPHEGFSEQAPVIEDPTFPNSLGEEEVQFFVHFTFSEWK